MAKRSKAYEAAAAKIDAEKHYAPFEAVTLAKDTNPSKFDATVEVAFRLGVDPRKADQMVSLAGVNAEAEGHLNRGVELGRVGVLGQRYCLERCVVLLRVDLGGCC